VRDDQACAVGKALGRADVAEQDDRYANLEAQLVRSEAGRVAGVEELGRELSCMCKVWSNYRASPSAHEKWSTCSPTIRPTPSTSGRTFAPTTPPSPCPLKVPKLTTAPMKNLPISASMASSPTVWGRLFPTPTTDPPLPSSTSLIPSKHYNIVFRQESDDPAAVGGVVSGPYGQ